MRRKIFFAIFLSAIILLASVPALAQEVLFEMSDPEGDDYGWGKYTYPTNVAFTSGSGHFDLVNFVVSTDEKYVYFDFEFAKLENVFNAYEGFSHQLIDLYIDLEPGGETQTLRPGANVQFDSNYAWDLNIRIAPFKQSYIHSLKQLKPPAGEVAMIVERVLDTNIIRACVDKTLIGEPDRSWNYYVLVGSYDSYGSDCYRPVEKNSNSWVFGGAEGPCDPQIIDMLASSGGDKAQESQLRSFSNNEGKLATLTPVGAGMSKGGSVFGTILKYIGLIALLVSGFFLVKKRLPLSQLKKKESSKC